MTVQELMEKLQKLPPEAVVFRADEGEIRGEYSAVNLVEYKPTITLGWSGGVLLK